MVRAAKTVAGVGVLLGCLALWLVPVAGAAAFSDSFAGRSLVKGAPQEITGSNVGAGTEAGEPVPNALAPAGHSVWIDWEATTSKYFSFSTCGSAIPTVLALYVGPELSKLTEEGSVANYGGSDCSGVENGVTMLVLNGGTFHIRLDGNSYFVEPAPPPVTEGALKLRVEATPTPLNDSFENAEAIEGSTSEEPSGARFYSAGEPGYNYNATKQTGEPKHDGDQGGASVWYTWTAPESGVARLSLCCGTVNLIGVYTGSAVNSLTPVGSGKGSAEIPVTAGTTYKIAVDSEFSFFLGGTFDDKFNLMLAMQLAPGPGTGGGAGPSSDTTPPKTTLLKARKSKKPTTRTFAYKSSEAHSTFRCRLDRQPFAACGSSKTYKNLKPGKHKFEVFAIDAAGNKDSSPAVVRFMVPPQRQRHQGH